MTIVFVKVYSSTDQTVFNSDQFNTLHTQMLRIKYYYVTTL